MASTTAAAPSARPRVPSASSLLGGAAAGTGPDAPARATPPVSRPADPRRPAAVVSALPRPPSAGGSGGGADRPRPSSFSPIRAAPPSAGVGPGADAVATNLFRSPAGAGAARPATVSGKKRRRRNAPKFLSDFVMEEDGDFESPDKGRAAGGPGGSGSESRAAAAVVSARKDEAAGFEGREGRAAGPGRVTTVIAASGGPAGGSPPRPSAPAVTAAGPAAGGGAILHLYSPIVVGGGTAPDSASDAVSRRSVARTRGELLSGVDAWFCSHCNGCRVASLTLPCGKCGRRVEFIPLDPAELRDFVRGQRERDGGRSVTEWHRRVKRMRTKRDGDGDGGAAGTASGEASAPTAPADGSRRQPPATPARAASGPPPSAPETPGPLGDQQSSLLAACESLLSIASPDKREVTFADGDAAFSFATFDPKSPGLGLLKSPGMGLLKSPGLGLGLGFDLLRSPGLAALVKSPGLEMSASEHELIMGSPAAPPPGMAHLAGLAVGASPIAGGNDGGGKPGMKLYPARRPAATSAEMEIKGPTFDLNRDDGAAPSDSKMGGGGGAGSAAASSALAAAAAAKDSPSHVPTIHVPPRRSASLDSGKKQEGGASTVGKFLESMASVSLGVDKPGGKGGGEAASKRMMAKAVLVSPRLSASPPKSSAAAAGGEKMATATPVDSETPKTKFDLIKSRSRERAARKRTAAVAAAVAAARQQSSFGSSGENEDDGDEYVDDAIRDDEDDDWSPSSKSPAAKPAKRSHKKRRASSGSSAAVGAGQAPAEQAAGSSEPPPAPTRRARGRPRKPEAAGGSPPGRGKPSRSPKIPRKSKAPAAPKRKYIRRGGPDEEELARASSSVPELRGDEESFTLYHPDDDKYINELHTIIRRDIWEGFVVDDQDAGQGGNNNDGRLSCYVGTVGFRCRWCKDVDPTSRAEKSAVYPRELERIYHANIRFQRDHVP